MNAPSPKLNALLNTSQSLAHLQWSQLLECQVAVFFATELQAFLSSPEWRNARRVLDGGCGNGYYLSQLRSYFPDKTYTGLDLSSEHMSAARANPSLADITLHEGDLLDFQPAELFDAIILRLVVQHLQGLQPVMAALNRLVVPGGSVFILEPDPSAFLTYPQTPKFLNLLRCYEQATTGTRSNRAQLQELPLLLNSIPGWSVVQSRSYSAPSAGQMKSHPLLQIFSLWLDIFERSKVLDADFSGAREELEQWASQSAVYCQIGFMFIELRRMG